jgi:PhnB protein
MTGLHPYLNFGGDCEAAFDFYRSVFGGEFSNVSRYSDMPPETPGPEVGPDKIMHISLPVGEDQVLMGSDRPASMGPTTQGDNVHVSVDPDSEEDAKRIFEHLSEGGTITMPYEKTFWGAYFGMCTDKFGINWMVNYEIDQ